MKIIGITGTIGAGKGTIVDYLIDHHHFRHYSVRGFLLEEIERRGLEHNRDSMVAVANDLRARYCPSYIIDCLYEEAAKSGENCIIESIRTPGEIESLGKKGDFTLFAIDADTRLRYDRIVLRDSETDHISYETFLDNEKREMDSVDPSKQNLRKCIELSDHIFFNNGSREELYYEIEKVITKIFKHE